MISLKNLWLQALTLLLTLTAGTTDLLATWSEPATFVTGPLIRSQTPYNSVSSDPSGTTSNALAVWVFQDAASNTFNIRGSFYNGTSWDPTSTTIATLSANDRSFFKRSEVKIHSINKGVAIWTKYDGVANEFSVQFSAYNGTSWSTPSTLPGSTLSGVDGSLLDYATLSIDPTTGQGASNWVSFNGAKGLYTLYASTYDGTSWSAPKVLSQVSGTLAYQTPFLYTPAIAVYSEGGSLRALSAWTHGQGTSENIEYSVYDGSSWSAPVILSTVTGPGSFSNRVVIALSPSTGDGILGWNTYDSSTLTSSVVAANYDATTKQAGGVTILETLDNYATGDNLRPISLSVNSVGQGVLIWNSNNTLSIDLVSSIFDGTSWNNVLATSTTGGFSAWDVAVNPTGTDITADSKAAIILFNVKELSVNNMRSLTLTGGVWTRVPPAVPAASNFIHRSSASSSSAINEGARVSQSGQGNGVGLWSFSTAISQIALLSSAYNNGGNVWSPTGETALTTYPAPFILENSFGGASQNPTFQFAMNGSGNALSVWTPYVASTTANSGTNSIFTSFLSGTIWQTPQLIAQVTGSTNRDAISGAFVGIDATNNGAAIWNQTNTGPTANTVMGASYINGGWSSPTTLVTHGTNTFSQSTFALTPAGQGMAAWRRSTGTLEAVPYAGNSWGALSTIVAAVNAGQDPSAAVDGNGNAIVLYRTTTNPRRIEFVRYDRAANTWSPFTTITSTASPQGYVTPIVVLGNSGKGFAVWGVNSTASGFNVTVRVEASSYNGTSWSAPVTLFSRIAPFGNFDTIGNISAGIAQDGKGAATWYYYDGVRTTQVMVADYDGTSWSAPQVIETVSGGASPGAIGRPFVNYNSSGNGLLTWRFTDNTFLREYIGSSVYQRATGVWLPVQTAFASLDNSVALPRSGIDDSNRAVAATLSTNDGSIDTSLISVFGSGLFAPPPASNLKGKVIKEKFATQTDIIHRLKWTASADSTVTSYLIYRNGVLIAEVSAKATLRYYDHNRRPHVVDHYTVYAVNSVGTSSGISVDVP